MIVVGVHIKESLFST